MKNIVAAIFGFILLLTLIPLSIFLVLSENEQGPSNVLMPPTVKTEWPYAENSEEELRSIVVPVMRYESNVLEEVDLEQYIIGVVASEMSPTFEIEALKAQAVAARTFVLYSLQSADYVVDTVMDQVFRDESQLRERWGQDFDRHWETISEAVMATKGLVMTHNDELIAAMFFSMSNGRTENSEEVFSSARPYLRSIESPWDLQAPRFETETEFTLADFRNRLGNNSLNVSDISILSRTTGGNVSEVQVGNTVMTGPDFRRALGLRSADFTIRSANNMVVITTRGNGHGVGMSQYGANELARQGKTFDYILNFYYQEIKIAEK